MAKYRHHVITGTYPFDLHVGRFYLVRTCFQRMGNSTAHCADSTQAPAGDMPMPPLTAGECPFQKVMGCSQEAVASLFKLIRSHDAPAQQTVERKLSRRECLFVRLQLVCVLSLGDKIEL